MKNYEKKELYALAGGACISLVLLLIFAKMMAMKDAPMSLIGLIGLVFVPLTISGMIIDEKRSPLAEKIALLPMVTCSTFILNWIILGATESILGAITSSLRDEPYIAVLVLTGVVSILATTCVRTKSLYWALAIAMICGIISASAYVWAGVFFSPYEVTGTSTSPEAVLCYKTDFTFSWGWEIVVAIFSSLIAMAGWLKKQN